MSEYSAPQDREHENDPDEQEKIPQIHRPAKRLMYPPLGRGDQCVDGCPIHRASPEVQAQPQYPGPCRDGEQHNDKEGGEPGMTMRVAIIYHNFPGYDPYKLPA
jgi:hypothetical protein